MWPVEMVKEYFLRNDLLIKRFLLCLPLNVNFVKMRNSHKVYSATKCTNSVSCMFRPSTGLDAVPTPGIHAIVICCCHPNTPVRVCSYRKATQ